MVKIGRDRLHSIPTTDTAGSATIGANSEEKAEIQTEGGALTVEGREGYN